MHQRPHGRPQAAWPCTISANGKSVLRIAIGRSINLAPSSRLFLPLTLRKKSLIPLPVRTQITNRHHIERSMQAFDLVKPVIRNITGLITRDGILARRTNTMQRLHRSARSICMYSYRSARWASYIGVHTKGPWAPEHWTINEERS